MGIQVLDFTGKTIKEENVPSALDIDVNEHLIWEVVTAEHANARQGTHKTKEKGEVRGGGKKPWKQKGTGRARAGSNRSPIWKGGGTTFGPRPRSYTQRLSRKKKQTAMVHILAAKIKENQLVILENWTSESASTKTAFNGFTKVIEGSSFYEKYSEGRKLRVDSNDNRRKVAVVTATDAKENKLSLRNIPWIESLHVDRLAARTMFHNHGVIVTREAYDALVAKFGK